MRHLAASSVESSWVDTPIQIIVSSVLDDGNIAETLYLKELVRSFAVLWGQARQKEGQSFCASAVSQRSLNNDYVTTVTSTCTACHNKKQASQIFEVRENIASRFFRIFSQREAYTVHRTTFQVLQQASAYKNKSERDKRREPTWMLTRNHADWHFRTQW